MKRVIIFLVSTLLIACVTSNTTRYVKAGNEISPLGRVLMAAGVRWNHDIDVEVDLSTLDKTDFDNYIEQSNGEISDSTWRAIDTVGFGTGIFNSVGRISSDVLTGLNGIAWLLSYEKPKNKLLARALDATSIHPGRVYVWASKSDYPNRSTVIQMIENIFMDYAAMKFPDAKNLRLEQLNSVSGKSTPYKLRGDGKKNTHFIGFDYPLYGDIQFSINEEAVDFAPFLTTTEEQFYLIRAYIALYKFSDEGKYMGIDNDALIDMTKKMPDNYYHLLKMRNNLLAMATNKSILLPLKPSKEATQVAHD